MINPLHVFFAIIIAPTATYIISGPDKALRALALVTYTALLIGVLLFPVR